MTTKTVPVNNYEYTKLDSFPESALDMQNVSKHTVRLVFADTATPPDKEETAYYLLNPNQGMARDNKTGDMYALLLGAATGNVTVGE